MIFRDVAKNKMKTTVIITLFVIFISLLVYFISVIFLEDVFIAFALGIIFSMVSAIISYFNCDKMVLSINGARPATREEFLQLNVSLESLCIAAGLPLPRLYVIDSPALNAFATGRNPQHAVVCVTTGLLNKLDKYEMEGVLAHELSHIKNYDILLSTIAIIMVGFVEIIADMVVHSYFFHDNDNDSKAGLIMTLIGMVFLILSPIVANILKLAISRNREYLADASAVQITRNKEGLISALMKLEADTTPVRSANKAAQSLYIVNPLKNKKKQKDSIFSTHPNTANRIERLRNIS